MRISDKGLDLIKAQEGYHTRQEDGSCKAYRCPAGVWTCGWGSTVGVHPTTQWTREEATEALRWEMATHEQAVEKMAKVSLTQGQFDALVSLCYNIGAGALAKSTLMRHLNAGDYARAASHFGDFKRARVRGATARLYKVKDGTSVVLPGLVTRRAAEAQLFLEAAPVEMPQKVEPPPAKLRVGETLAKVGVPAGLLGGGSASLPAAPDLAAVTAWKGALVEAQGLMQWAWANPVWTAIGVGAFVLLGWVLPQWAEGRS